MASLPLLFGSILAGGVVIHYGSKSLSEAWATSSTPAGTGGATSATATVNAAGGTNPVPGATKSRVDEGGDYTLGPQGFLAPWKSQVVSTSGSFFRGGQIVLKLLEGPYAGSEYYVAEGVSPATGVTQGAIVNGGQQVAVPAVSPYNGILGNIEAGWWTPGGSEPLAKTTGGYSEGQVTAAGVAWNDLVHALGGVTDTFGTAVRGTLSGVPQTGY